MVDVGFIYSTQTGFTPNAGAHPAIMMHRFAVVFSDVRLASCLQNPNLDLALGLSQKEAE
jgi:hypothetical protein